MRDILIYLYYTMLDGDYANDYLTHVPLHVQPFLMFVGQLLTEVFSR